ncbi:MAG: TrmH family RNA methyltransferase [Planctomycetota bacterium]
MQEIIRSPSNFNLKRARAVGAGREDGLVLLEGQRLVEEAMGAGWGLELVLVSDRMEAIADELMSRAGGDTAVQCVEHSLLERVSPMKGAPGVLAIAREPEPYSLGQFGAPESGLLVVAAGVQDPGNLGAIARAAEAAGATGLVVAGAGARPFGSKALRGSMGSLLRLPVAVEPDGTECARSLGQAGWRQALATARDGVPFAEFNWKGPLALWLAAESGDLPAGVDAERFEGITIPMAGAVESLNVATAAAILCFAAGRVQDSKKARGEQS